MWCENVLQLSVHINAFVQTEYKIAYTHIHDTRSSIRINEICDAFANRNLSWNSNQNNLKLLKKENVDVRINIFERSEIYWAKDEDDWNRPRYAAI